MAKDLKNSDPVIKISARSNLSRRFVVIESEDQKGLITPAKVRPKLNEAEAQKIHRDLHTGADAFKVNNSLTNPVPPETPIVKKRGPKPSGNARSNAERVAAYRAKKRGEK